MKLTKRVFNNLLTCAAVLLAFACIAKLITSVFQYRPDYISPFVYLFPICMFFVLMSYRNRKRKAVFYYRNYLQGDKTMESGIFERILGQKVTIATIEDIVEGTVDEIDGDFVVVNKYAKDGSVKATYFVNKNMIASITLQQTK